MAHVNLELPDALQRFVDAKVAAGEYDSADEYLRSLIRRAQEEEQEQERLESLLLEGLDSGPGTEVTPEFWRELRAELTERHGRVNKP